MESKNQIKARAALNPATLSRLNLMRERMQENKRLRQQAEATSAFHEMEKLFKMAQHRMDERLLMGRNIIRKGDFHDDGYMADLLQTPLTPNRS